MKKSLQTNLCMVMASFLPSLMHANTYTFTSAGATGREGPTQAQVDANYTGTTLDGEVTINTQGIQEWTVPADGNYTIEARGASGGDSSVSNSSIGGRGIIASGTFELSKDEVIKILVGQSGEDSSEANSGKSAGGGGGTFVIRSPYNTSLSSILLAVGGGGGAGFQSVDGENGNGSDGSASNNGESGKGSGGGSGGTSGNAGEYSASSGTSGGAGYLQNSTEYTNWASAANSFMNGGTGSQQNGTNSGNSALRGGDGGFGGGGAGAYGGGGGGGFSGGGGGHFSGGDKGGGGGGSYNTGTDQNNSAGFNEGQGLVIITPLQSYVFTSAGATGRNGPTQSQIDANYSGTNLDGTVTINTQGIQEWTVPASGKYKIEALGASGGNYGGWGARMSGTFSLSANELIYIAVGQKGLQHTSYNESAGGGGGSFVVKNASALLIAGGGAGGIQASSLDGGTTTTANNDSGVAAQNAGGSNGSGGSSGGNWGGAGGGGFSGEGGNGNNSGSVMQNSGGKNWAGGLLGGLGGGSYGKDGGFGGGGASSWASGGGGGYSGGAGKYSIGQGNEKASGGGGGSYNSGTDQNNTAGTNQGHGLVFITFLSSSNNQSQSPVINQGAGPLTKTIDEDTNATWTASELNATDSDTNASSLTWSMLSSPSNGSITVDGNGSSPTSLSYQPNVDYHGSDSFSVQVSDGENNDSITIDLTISPIDDATIIIGDANATISEDTSATGDLNATDADGLTDGSYFSVSTPPANGSAVIDPVDGNWTYSPNPNFFGSDSFVVSVTDDLNTTTTSTINLSVSPIGDATIVSGHTNVSIAEDKYASGELNATDADGLTDGSYFSISTFPASGSAAIDPVDGNWTYSPNPNFFGSDSFVVSITDDLNTSATTTINLSISALDDATIIIGDTNASIVEDGVAYGDLNATDADGLTDGSLFSITTAPANGSASIDPADGNWTYSPNPNYFGSDSFVISITDDLNTSATTTINLSIYALDDAIIIIGDTNASIVEDGMASGDFNATDADGLSDGSYFTISTSPSNGSANIDPIDGNWSYSPNPNFFGFDSFVVSVTDDLNTSTTLTINLSVSSVDDTTIIIGDTNTSITEDGVAYGDLNATDADGLTDGSYFSISTAPANGSASIDPVDGNWTYSPTPNFFGFDSFVVSITDDLNTSTTTSINLSISSVDDATSITGDTQGSIAEDSTAYGDLNATDADGLTDGSYFSISTAPANGSASIDSENGNWVYSPNPNFFGSDSFVVFVTDDLYSSTTTAISLSISSVDDATIVSGDTNASIAEDTYASGDLNAIDDDGLTDGSYFSVSTTPANGSASIDPVDGNWTYSPNPNFFGSDSFVVSITDDLNTSTTSTISLSVSSVDDTTSITGDTNASIAEDSSASGVLNAADDDGLTDGSYFSISTAPANGSASIDPLGGNWTYTPYIDFFGSDSFDVSVTDDLNTSFFTTINLSVIEVSEPDSDYTSPDDSTSSPDDHYTTPEDSSSSPDTGYQSPTQSYSSPDSNYSTPDDSTSSPDSAYATPDDSVTSPDEVYTSPNGDAASPDSGYQSPTESYSSPDSNYSTPDDSVSSPEDAYSTPDDSVTSPDEVHTSPNGDTASPDTGYQSPTQSYSTPDSNYSTPDDSISSPDSAYSTPDDSLSSPDEVYTSPSGISASPDTGYQSPTESYSSPDSNYSTPDDSISSPDSAYSTPDDSLSSPNEVYSSPSGITSSPDSGYLSPTESYSSPDSNYTTPDDSVSLPDDQYASPEYHLPLVETGQPIVDTMGSLTLSGSVYSDGGSTLLEVGFLLSSTLDFNQSERFVTELDSTTGEFLLQTSNDSAQFVRAFASNAVGESLGQVVAFESPSSESSAWVEANRLQKGWLQSDWLGTFKPYANGWIFHARLGWLYTPVSTVEGIWLWSSTEGWLWTQNGIAPHFFNHESANWLYLLPAGEHGNTFYDYAIEDVR